MASFAGKDFLKMQPPPGYVPGVGRGAVGFSTQSIVLKQRGNVDVSKMQERDRFIDPDEDADAVYDLIEAKRKRKKRKIKKVDEDTHDELKLSVSMDEWLALPDAKDSTKRNQRLRTQTKQTMRFYTASDKLKLTEEDTKSADQARKRSMLEELVRHHPGNSNACLQLAELEQTAGHFKRARSVAMRGVLHGDNEDLWLKVLELAPIAEAQVLAEKACSKLKNSERIWIKRVELAQNDTEKLLLVHEALITCTKSRRLWDLAIEMEPGSKEAVKDTAKMFIEDYEEPIEPIEPVEAVEPVEPEPEPEPKPEPLINQPTEHKTELKPAVERARLSKLTTENPHSPQSWVDRINFEKQQQKPFKHLISEALLLNPSSGELWVLELEHTDGKQLMKRLVEAVKASNSAEVFEFGAKYFEAAGNIEKAKLWHNKALNLIQST